METGILYCTNKRQLKGCTNRYLQTKILNKDETYLYIGTENNIYQLTIYKSNNQKSNEDQDDGVPFKNFLYLDQNKSDLKLNCISGITLEEELILLVVSQNKIDDTCVLQGYNILNQKEEIINHIFDEEIQSLPIVYIKGIQVLDINLIAIVSQDTTVLIYKLQKQQNKTYTLAKLTQFQFENFIIDFDYYYQDSHLFMVFIDLEGNIFLNSYSLLQDSLNDSANLQNSLSQSNVNNSTINNQIFKTNSTQSENNQQQNQQLENDDNLTVSNYGFNDSMENISFQKRKSPVNLTGEDIQDDNNNSFNQIDDLNEILDDSQQIPNNINNIISPMRSLSKFQKKKSVMDSHSRQAIIKQLKEQPTTIKAEQLFSNLVSQDVLQTNVINSFCKFYPSDASLQFEELPTMKKNYPFNQSQKQQQINGSNYNNNVSSNFSIKKTSSDGNSGYYRKNSDNITTVFEQKTVKKQVNLIITSTNGECYDFDNINVQSLKDITLLPTVNIKNTGITGCDLFISKHGDLNLFLSYFNGSLINYSKNFSEKEHNWKLKLNQPLNSNHYGVHFCKTSNDNEDLLFLISDNILEYYQVTNYSIN